MFRQPLFVSLITIASTSFGFAASYRIEDFSTSGRVVDSIALNNAGDIVYSVLPEDSVDSPPLPGEAFLIHGDTVTSLSFVGDSSTVSTDINDVMQVVGYALGPSGNTAAVRYDNGQLSLIAVDGRHQSLATSINNSGDIVGQTVDGTASHAFLMTRTGDFQRLATLGGNVAIAHDINEVGTIVGESRTESDDFFVAFAYYVNDVVNLGTLGGDSSSASALNEDSVIVGSSTTENGIQHAALFEVGSPPTDLAPLWAQSGASDVNNRNQIVGFVTDTPDQEFQGALFSIAGPPMLLADLIDQNSGWDVLGSAAAINDLGQIVGVGVFRGEPTIYLMTPIPEPSTFPSLVLAFGIGVLSRFSKK
jgi:probable HAF family extracellular repeat protein